MCNKKYNTKYGIYEHGCGLDNTICCWGHDEYLYRILKNQNKKINLNLPEEVLYIIRYHSLYLHHDKNSYSHLLNDKDKQYLGILKHFNSYDLYSKSDIISENKKKELKNIIQNYLLNLLIMTTY